jgi:hypothetical protein
MVKRIDNEGAAGCEVSCGLETGEEQKNSHETGSQENDSVDESDDPIVSAGSSITWMKAKRFREGQVGAIGALYAERRLENGAN